MPAKHDILQASCIGIAAAEVVGAGPLDGSRLVVLAFENTRTRRQLRMLGMKMADAKKLHARLGRAIAAEAALDADLESGD